MRILDQKRWKFSFHFNSLSKYSITGFPMVDSRLSLKLYTLLFLFTQGRQSRRASRSVLKYADDSVIVNRLQGVEHGPRP